MPTKSYSTKLHHLSTTCDRTISAGHNYSMLFISRGSCYLDLDGAPTSCGTEDVLVLKPGTKVSLHYKASAFPLEYILVSATPDFLMTLSDSDTSFEDALSFLPKEMALSHLKSESAMLIKNIAIQIISLNEEPDGIYGHNLFVKNLYSMLVLLTIRSCIESDSVVRKHRTKKLIMDEIFAYISRHLNDDLSLEALAQEFHVSKYYICREFKRLTGLSPHSYIVKARLSLCCQYIEQGLPINEVYHLGGFGDYNHFFRAFKNEYDMTPKEYYSSAIS